MNLPTRNLENFKVSPFNPINFQALYEHMIMDDNDYSWMESLGELLLNIDDAWIFVKLNFRRWICWWIFGWWIYDRNPW